MFEIPIENKEAKELCKIERKERENTWVRGS